MPFENLPAKVRLVFAGYEPGDPLPEDGAPVRLSIEEPSPKAVTVVLEVSQPGWGFGQFTIRQTPRGVFIDTECTTKELVKKAFADLIETGFALKAPLATRFRWRCRVHTETHLTRLRSARGNGELPASTSLREVEADHEGRKWCEVLEHFQHILVILPDVSDHEHYGQ